MSTNATHECGGEDFVAFLQRSADAPYSVAKAFFAEISMTNDSGVLEEFLSWRTEPRVSSLVQLALGVGSDRLDQLLFVAEDLYSDAMGQTNANRR